MRAQAGAKVCPCCAARWVTQLAADGAGGGETKEKPRQGSKKNEKGGGKTRESRLRERTPRGRDPPVQQTHLRRDSLPPPRCPFAAVNDSYDYLREIEESLEREDEELDYHLRNSQ